MSIDQPALRASGPPPRLKDRYRLVAWLGKGGMGIVYRAHDELLNREVAVKFLASEWLGSNEIGDRFRREARAVARLSHPNIMMLYDLDQEASWHYLVLEYIPGQDLEARRLEQGGRLPASEAMPIVQAVLEALAYAHAQGVIHRDIKPQNIMLTPKGQVKVTDFGLALAQDDIRLTQEGTIIGSPFYLAPEMVSDGLADHRTDLYAVGAVLYELLTGRPPFTGNTPITVLSQVLTTPVLAPRVLEPDIPLTVEAAILKLLAKRPSDRYPSAEEALAALQPELVTQPGLFSQGALPGQMDKAPSELAPLEAALALRYAEDTAAAIESERRRLAQLLQSEVIEPLHLLLSQTHIYEQTLGANPTARMAVSVLSTLARQTLQQVRDLENNLHPTILERLGLEPALETLASQIRRSHGLQITLTGARLLERLPSQVELALFRATQAALERAVQQGHASEVTIHLERQHDRLLFHLIDNSLSMTPAPVDILRSVCQRLEQIGGAVKRGPAPEGGFQLQVTFALVSPIQLTSRELEVLQLLARGLSNKQIARALAVTPRTVNFHLDNIYSKLGVSSRTEAVIVAVRQGILALKGEN
jgi:serine/threonine protein kinase/DNA-binding CsgD family transcriptional regulator